MTEPETGRREETEVLEPDARADEPGGQHWQPTRGGDRVDRTRDIARADAEKGAVAGGIWGCILLVSGFSWLFDTGPSLRTAWTLASAAAALSFSTQQSRMGFGVLAALAFGELSVRLSDIPELLDTGSLPWLIVAAAYTSALPVLMYIFVEAYRGAYRHVVMTSHGSSAPQLDFFKTTSRIVIIGISVLAFASVFSQLGGAVLHSFSWPGAKIPSKEERLAELGRAEKKLNGLDVKPFQEGKRRTSAPDVTDMTKRAKDGDAPATDDDGLPRDDPDADAPVASGSALRADHEPYADNAKILAGYRKAAEQGSADAQNNLGLMYAEGTGVPQDYAEALEWYRKAADQGNADAQNNLGLMYGSGRGVERDDEVAVGWYRKAAEQGNAAAELNLGLMYSRGHGLPRDPAAALEWYRRAAEQGNAAAQLSLGLALARGAGGPKDDVVAHKWLNLAAAQGVTGAATARDAVAARMGAQQIADAQKAAREWKASEPAAANGE